MDVHALNLQSGYQNPWNAYSDGACQATDIEGLVTSQRFPADVGQNPPKKEESMCQIVPKAFH
jgi:hypothetical protein